MSEETITKKYLVFDTEDEGLERADVEGQLRNYSYHCNGIGTRYYSTPVPCEDGTWALDVTFYKTLNENESTVNEVVLLTYDVDGDE